VTSEQALRHDRHSYCTHFTKFSTLITYTRQANKTRIYIYIYIYNRIYIYIYIYISIENIFCIIRCSTSVQYDLHIIRVIPVGTFPSYSQCPGGHPKAAVLAALLAPAIHTYRQASGPTRSDVNSNTTGQSSLYTGIVLVQLNAFHIYQLHQPRIYIYIANSTAPIEGGEPSRSTRQVYQLSKCLPV